MNSQPSSAASSSSAQLEQQQAGNLLKTILALPVLRPIATFAAILVVWELSTIVFAIPSFLLPAPTRIVTGFDAVEFSRWIEHIWATLRVALYGYITAIVIALPLADDEEFI